MTKRSAPLEIALSAAWHAGSLGDRFVTTDESTVQVIHRGGWSHGLGPDFRDALLLFNDREMRSGSIEIHLDGRAWFEHQHHLDPAYNDVILHVVSKHLGQPTRRLDGAIIPTVICQQVDLPVPDLAYWDWDRVGGEVCAARLAQDDPHRLRQLLHDLGDRRLAVRSARIEARLSAVPPAQVLWEEIMDGLGYSANREPMVSLAKAVRIEALQSLLAAIAGDDRESTALGVLLGAAGFLPLSPAEAHLACLDRPQVEHVEEAWRERSGGWSASITDPLPWRLARVRPANHPAARLVAAANLVVNTLATGGFLPTIIGVLGDPGDPAQRLRELAAGRSESGLGIDRIREILASGIVPFALGLAAQTGDDALLDAATGQWERLSAPAKNAVTARAWRQVAGPAPIGKIGARGAQGLIQLDTMLCRPRRCFECPVAAAELAVKG